MEKTKKNRKPSFKNVLFLLAFMATLLFAGTLSASADDDIKPKRISPVKRSVTVTAGKEFELKVRKSPSKADEDYLYWSIISGKSYVRFEDSDRTDDEVELKAVKAGTAKLRCRIRGTKKSVTFTVKVKSAPKKIYTVGSRTKKVEAGDDFELKIKKYSGLKDKYLKWSIKNSKIVRFEDRDRTGDEVEFEARRPGTTTITCRNVLTRQSVTYTIKVVPDDDDRDDDDDDDDDRDDD